MAVSNEIDGIEHLVNLSSLDIYHAYIGTGGSPSAW